MIIGQAKGKVFAARVQELIAAETDLAAAVQPLLRVRDGVVRQLADLERKSDGAGAP